MDPHASAPGGTMLSTQVDPAASLERFKAQQRHPWAANDELGLAHESADAAPGVVAADVAVDVAGTTPGMTSAPWEVASYEPPLSPELADAIQDLWGPLDSSAQLEEEMPMWGPTRGAQGTGMPSGHQAGPAGGSLQRNGGAPADSGDKGSAAPGAENGGEPMGPQESPAQHAGSAPLGAKQGPAQADPQRPSLAGRLASVLEKIKAKEASQNALKDYTLFRRNLEAQTGDGDRLEAAQLGTPLGPSVQVGVPGASQGEASRGGIGAVQVHGGDIAVHGGQSAARGSKHASVLLRLPSSGNGVAAGLATAEASSMGGRRDAVERPVPINATWQAGQSRQAAGVGHWGGQEAQVLVGEPSVGSGLGGQGMVGTQGLRSGEGAHPGSGVGNQAPPSRLGEELMMRFLQEAGVGPQAHPGPLTRQLQGTLRQQYLQDQLQQMEGHNQLESQRPDQPHNHEGKGMQQLLVFHHPAKQQSGGLESQSQKQGPAVGQQQKLHPFSPLPAASFNSGSSDSETLSGIPSDARVGSPSVNARLSGSLSESHHGPHSPASGSRLAATHTPLLLDSQAPSPTLTGLRLPSGVPQPEALFSSPDSPPESAREEKPLPELRHAAGGSHELASRLSTGALGGSQELASRLSADAVQSSFSSGDGGPSSVALARVLESRGSGSVASNLRGGDSLAQHMLSDAHALSELDSLAQSNGVKGVNSLAAIDNLAAANIRAQLGTLAQLASLARGRAVEGISSQADIDTLAEGFPLAGSGSDILAGVRRPEFDSLSGVQNLLGLRSMNTAELQRRWGVPHPTGSASDAEQHARQTPQAAAVGAVEQGSDEVPGSGAFVYGRTMGAREDGTWELTLAPALRRRGQQTSSGFLLASQLTPQESSLEASQEAALEGLLGNPWAMQRAQEAVLGAAAAGRQRRGVPGSHGVAEFLLSEVPEKVTGRVPRVYVRPRGSVTARDFHLGHPELRRIVLARLTKAATAYSSHQHDTARHQLAPLQELAAPVGAPVQRLIFYMLAALESRFEGRVLPPPPMPPPNVSLIAAAQEKLRSVWGSFNEATLATALASALVGHSRIHILVLTLTATPDWKLLFTSLAQHGLVAGATPPQVRITFIVPYIMSAPMVHIQKAFLVLRDQALAEGIICGVPVECTLVFAAPADFHPQLVRIDPAETVAVASWLALKTLPDGSVLRHSPRDSLLKWVASLRPTIFTVVESDGNFNSPFFVSRFTEVLGKIDAILHNIDGTTDKEQDPFGDGMSPLEGLIAMCLVNCIARDGLGRYERAETPNKWRERMLSLGFTERPFSEETIEALRTTLKNPNGTLTNDRGVVSIRWMDMPIMFAAAWA